MYNLFLRKSYENCEIVRRNTRDSAKLIKNDKVGVCVCVCGFY